MATKSANKSANKSSNKTNKSKNKHKRHRSSRLDLKAPIYTASYAHLFRNYIKMIETKKQITELEIEINELRQNARNIMKEREKQLQICPHVEHLKHMVNREKSLINEQRNVINKRKDHLMNACSVIKNSIANNKMSNQQVLDAIDSFHADSYGLETFDRKLKLRQHKMCRQLLHIFPFRRVRNASTTNNNLYTTNYEIRNMSLPSRVEKLLIIANAGGEQEEKMSIGLGYIAHLCILLSRYLQIPLRHSIICRGSRSEIVDTFAEAEAYILQQKNQKNKKVSKFPLYSKNTDKKLFRKGVELLQDDICQLCIAVDMKDFEPTAFIHNVRTVLYSQALARF